MNNKYFNHFDFYNMTNKDFKNGAFITHFKTLQQESDVTCASVCSAMILNYYGEKGYNEKNLSEILHTTEAFGTRLKNVVNFFKDKGYKVISSLDMEKDENGLCFSTFESFKQFILTNLKSGYPVVVENIDWGGHYKVIIGYDVQNDNESEDMIIFADPADCNDGCVDGYNYFPANRFYAMWFDNNCLYKKERKQPFLVVKNK